MFSLCHPELFLAQFWDPLSDLSSHPSLKLTESLGQQQWWNQMWAFQFCFLHILRKVQVWEAWSCNSHRAHAGNSSFQPLEQAQLLSWRSLWPFPDIVYGKSSEGCEPTLLAICTVYLSVPRPDLDFFHCYEKKDFIAVSTTVFLLMSPASIVFSIWCDKSVLWGLSSIWSVTSLAYGLVEPLHLFHFLFISVLPSDCNEYEAGTRTLTQTPFLTSHAEFG